MPDLLLLGGDSKSAFEIEELAKRLGFRVKCIFEMPLAIEWIKLKSFDAVCVPSGASIESQQPLADLLWRANPLAPLVVYDFAAGAGVVNRRARLFGADVAAGPAALLQIERILLNVKPSGSIKSENFRILVVEDLDSPRDIICAYVESLGFPSVEGVRSAREALDLLGKDPQHFSCVLTDIRMPRMTGEEMLRELRADKKLQHLPVVVLTAYGTVDCLIDCLKAGASGFLVKPPKRNDIVREVSRAYRLFSSGADPRLISSEEADSLRELLLERGTGLT